MKVLIFGAGTMGRGIAQIFIQNNHEVIIFNPKIDSAYEALSNIDLALSNLVTKGKLSQQQKEYYISNISVIDSLNKAINIDFVIEAVSENMEIKKKVFKELDSIVKNNVILATNTSSLSITELAIVTSRPEKIVGMHFFNPAPIMELVEVVKGMVTDESTIDFVKKISLELGKTPVIVNEAPGFIVNRMLIPMINEAVSIFQEGISTVDEIDLAVKKGANHPIGPFALADLIGIDVCLDILDTLHSEFGIDKYAANPLLRKMVRGNKLGRKTKQGFYTYD